MSNIVIAGYYGFSNAGDEAILCALIEELKKLGGNLNITVLSARPHKTASEYGVNSVKRSSLVQVFRAMRQSRIFISGGGSLLQDVTSWRSLYYYLFLMTLAKKLGLITVLYANGVGPINSPINRYITKAVLEQHDFLSVRDEESKSFLRKLGILKKAIDITADPAFTLKPAAPEQGAEILKTEGINPEDGSPIIGICIRPWKGENKDYRHVLAKAADFISREFKARILFVPLHEGEDRQESLEIMRLMETDSLLLKGSYNPKELMSVIGYLELLIGVRLHSLIFAAAVGTPFAGISYDPKIDSFLKSFNMGPIGRLEGPDLNDLLIKLDDVWRNRDNMRRKIKEKARKMAERVNEHNRQLFKLLNIMPS